jgi:ABC-type phosphate/phosphonate transport system substrate-binding protein
MRLPKPGVLLDCRSSGHYHREAINNRLPAKRQLFDRGATTAPDFFGVSVMFRKCFFGAAVWLALSCAASAQQQIVFAVNEGVTYRTGGEDARLKYKAIADDLGKLLKAKVRVDIIPEYATLEKDLAAKSYDIAFIHPTHIALSPVKKGAYSLVAVSKAHVNYRAQFLSKVAAQPKTPEELGKLLGAPGAKPIGSPDTNSITAWLIRATLRDAAAASKTKAPELKFTRFQDSIPHMVEYGFVDVAATASEAIVKEWTAAGGKVIATSKPVPIKDVIVSNALGKESIEAVKNYFIELSNSPDGQTKLERIGLKQGFIGYDQDTFVAIATWLGL